MKLQTIHEKKKSDIDDVLGFADNIEDETLKNDNFRKVLYTAKNSQLVLMALKPGEDIGSERHPVDQFFRIEKGIGESIINDTKRQIKDGSALIVPAGAKHNVVNTGTTPMKLYTVYSPPHHREGVIHKTRADAEADHEKFNGKTTE